MVNATVPCLYSPAGGLNGLGKNRKCYEDLVSFKGAYSFGV